MEYGSIRFYQVFMGSIRTFRFTELKDEMPNR
jgi:hypothetical protein